MARLLADENFPKPVVEVLRSLGHDVLMMHQVGMANQGMSDDLVLQFAITEARSGHLQSPSLLPTPHSVSKSCRHYYLYTGQ
jgi:hypothetical protein